MDCQQHSRRLVYEPQSNATPTKKSVISTAISTIPKTVSTTMANSDSFKVEQGAMVLAGTCSSIEDEKENVATLSVTGANVEATSRQRKRRSLFGSAKLSPTSKAAKQHRKSSAAASRFGKGNRRACLTDILIEDVQKAKELLGFRQKSTTATNNHATSSNATVSSAHEPSLKDHPLLARMNAETGSSSSADAFNLNRCDYHDQQQYQPTRRFVAPIALTEDDCDMEFSEEQQTSSAAGAAAAAAATTLPRRRSHRRHRRASSDELHRAMDEGLASSGSVDLLAPTSLYHRHLLKEQQQHLEAAVPDASGSAESSFHSQQQLLPLQAPPSSVRSLPHQQQQQQKQQSPTHKRRLARYWELKRLLAELTRRKTEKCKQLAALEAKEKSLSGEFRPRDCLTYSENSTDSLPRQQPQQGHQLNNSAAAAAATGGQLCFPTQYLVAVEEEAVQSELVQLQEEAAVQRAMVEANARLLRECQADKSGRQLKRKRLQEYQRSQEKLRSLNQRIAELRASETAANEAAAANWDIQDADSAVSQDQQQQQQQQQLYSPILSTNETGTWSPPLAAAQGGLVCRQHSLQQQRQLPDSRMRSYWQQQRSHTGQPASAVASTISVDSGYQEISCCTSSTTSLELQLVHTTRTCIGPLKTFKSSASGTLPAANVEIVMDKQDDIVAMDEDEDENL